MKFDRCPQEVRGRAGTLVNRRVVVFERHKNGFTITTDPKAFDLDAIHEFLSERAYWCLGVPRHVMEKAFERSLCFGMLEGEKQVGFARMVTDGATFAWLCDVYVIESYRGRGLGDWLIASVLEHPDLQGLRRIVLATRDAHGLYRRNGFELLPTPERWMAIAKPHVYETPELKGCTKR